MGTSWKEFQKNPPASPAAIREFEQESCWQLPQSYKHFLSQANGGEGFIGPHLHVVLWPVEELMRLNQGYEVDRYARGLLLIGSSGGGEAFALDRRLGGEAVVCVPFVGMDLALIRALAPNFDAFLTLPTTDEVPRGPAQDVAGKEVFEIHPVILGGSPTDRSNKIFLTREEHVEAVRYWNKVIRELRKRPDGPR